MQSSPQNEAAVPQGVCPRVAARQGLCHLPCLEGRHIAGNKLLTQITVGLKA